MESEKFLLWKQRLEDIKQSDLTVDEWCTKNQVSKHAYVKYYYGEVGEKNEAICCSDYSSDLFEKAVEIGSTKGIFCGHDHYNNISLEYKNIRLTYGMSIDYLAMPGISRDTKQRGATTILIHEDGSFDVEPVQYHNQK